MNRTNKAVFLLLTLALALSLLPWSAVPARAADPEDIGSIRYAPALGAYEISSAGNLHDLAVYVNGSGAYTTGGDAETTAHDCTGLTFKMTGNIALTHTTAWNNSESTENNYTAIGNGSYPFKGTFDGQNYTVSGIRIYKTGKGTDAMWQGLFGVVRDGGTVKDVEVSDVRIQGYGNIGAVVGLAWPNATVSGCVVADAFLADGGGGGGYVGGVAGNATGAAVSDCHASETVIIHAAASASSHGGVVGDVSGSGSSSGSITGCTSAATLTIADGIAGCKYFGGIVGHSSNASVANCRAVGVTVPATSYNSNDTSGAIAGDVRNSTLTDNYYLNCTVSGTPNAVDSGVGCNESDSDHRNDGTYSLHTVTLDAGLSVSGKNVTIGSVPYYPNGETITLGSGGCAVTVDGSDPVQYVPITETAGVYTFTMPSGNVTVSGPPDYAGLWHADDDHDGTTEARAYVITTPAGLNLLASEVNNGNSYSGKFFKLGADITYAHTTDWNDAGSTENNYVAIGKVGCNFCGTFDGCGHTVSGIRICKSGEVNQGLFGIIRQAAVKNITLTDARITGNGNAGGIAGYSAGGTVSDCTVTGTVAIHAAVDSSIDHGGIVGCNSPDSLRATVTGCTSSAKLTMADGLNNCTSWGGIVGWNDGSGAVVENCFAAGVTIEGWGLRGAVVGSNEKRLGTTIGTLTGNYYTGCAVDGKTIGIGVGLATGSGGAEDQAGARCVGRITLGDGVAVTNGITVNAVQYILVGWAVTLRHGDAPAGYRFGGYSVKDAAGGTVTVDENGGFTMPAGDVTAEAVFEPLPSLWVGGVELGPERQTVTDGNGGTAALSCDDGGNPVLTLTDYVYEGAGYTDNYGGMNSIYFSEKIGNAFTPLTVVLNGENRVTNTGGEKDSYAVFAEGALTVTGTGSMVAAGGPSGSGSSGGIGCRDFTLTGGTVTAAGGATNDQAGASYGLRCIDSACAVTGGTLTAAGGAGAQSYGIGAIGGVTVGSGAAVTAAGGAEAGYSCGISAFFATVAIGDGAALTAAGGNEALDVEVKNAAAGAGCESADGAGAWTEIAVNTDNGAYCLSKKAVFPAALVNLRYDGNGATDGTMEGYPVPSGVAVPLTASAFTRVGHTFGGWNTAADGSGTAYPDGGSATLTADTTLYAQWTANRYAVTVNSGKADKTTAAQGETVKVTANAPATGKVFDRWTSSDGVTFADAYSAATTFTMPAQAVAVTAAYHDYSLANGKVYAPKGAVLICATYSGGRMTGMQSVTLAGDCANADAATLLGAALPASGYQLMLVNASTYAPLCEAWEG